MAFKHISLFWSAKRCDNGHVGDTAFVPGQKNKQKKPKKTTISRNVGDTAFLPGQNEKQ